MADLTPKPGGLLWLSPAERRIIDLLRADPDQEQHVVDVAVNGDATVRHPISERLEGDLFDCPALEDVNEIVTYELIPPGRYRMKVAISGATYLEGIE